MPEEVVEKGFTTSLLYLSLGMGDRFGFFIFDMLTTSLSSLYMNHSQMHRCGRPD
jgi:hypothetical protein